MAVSKMPSGQRHNDAALAKGLVERTFEFSCTRPGFKVSLDKEVENLLITLPKQKRPSIKIGVWEAITMNGSGLSEWCRNISRSIDRD